MKYTIDTHALIWYLEGNNRLSPAVAAILANPASELILPAIALAEALWITERGKTSIPSAQSLLTAVIADPRIAIVPLDEAVVAQTLNLTAINEMHDRQIVATAIVAQTQGNQVALLTCDQNITASGTIAILW
ncbi:MAG: type II toxin-antitoxin system VapC family toxin [Alkalinema sp. RU_4_3]|nr:type II toxin-antitoxin system VapC family toxin [Alkalinema sp. RU_4_3]